MTEFALLTKERHGKCVVDRFPTAKEVITKSSNVQQMLIRCNKDTLYSMPEIVSIQKTNTYAERKITPGNILIERSTKIRKKHTYFDSMEVF